MRRWFQFARRAAISGRMRHLLPLLLIAAPLAAAAQTEALVDYVVENGSTIPDPLAEWEGGVEAGAALHQSAGCADCHAAPGFEDAPAIGPDLSGVADRLTEGETRLMVVNPRIVLPETDMPAYYAVGQIGEVPDDLVGRTRLTPLEVEQIVAWLMSLSD